jgi:lipopolysaccharide biosynthesis protein
VFDNKEQKEIADRARLEAALKDKDAEVKELIRNLSRQVTSTRSVKKIATTSLKILVNEGPWSLLTKIFDKIGRKEFRLLELPSPEGIKWRYANLRRHPKTEFGIFRDFYQNMMSVAVGEANRETLLAARKKLPSEEPPVKLIAFYLPQFHPIPENDAWWERGFTEWTNVSKAVPQFVGHYQPRLPGELGFYDLRVPEVQEAQINLARQYGIYGFCFYYYWFDNKRLLERPLDQFLTNSNLDFPFCLCWANENWTRRWDGQTKNVLIGQTYSSEWDLKFIQSIENALRDRRYIRIHGKPLLIIYNAAKLPSAQSTAERWREYCRSNGIGDLYLAAAQTFRFIDPRPIGFDAAIGFPPHNIIVPKINSEVELLNPKFSGKIFDYRDIVEDEIANRRSLPFERFLTVMTGWDNEPRRPGRGTIYAFSTPMTYAKWLEHACERTARQPDTEKRLVFINAWNEWAEGTYLEPDRRYGRAYLRATESVLNSLSSRLANKNSQINVDGFLDREVKKHAKTAVIYHLYYPELVEEAFTYLENLTDDFDLFISIPKDVRISENEIKRKHSNVYFYRCKNRGRDIAPFLEIFRQLYRLDYEYMCKIHSKKSRHRTDGDLWRHDVYSKLLGSQEIVLKIKAALRRPYVGIVAPAGHVLASEYHWGLGRNAKANRTNVARLCHQVGIAVNIPPFRFVAGSMFWFKPSALYLLTKLTPRTSDFESERGQRDGTLAHAFERFFGLASEQAGLEIVEINVDGQITTSRLGATFCRWAAPTRNGKNIRNLQDLKTPL